MTQYKLYALGLVAVLAMGCRDERRPMAPSSVESAIAVRKGTATAVVVVEPGATRDRAVLTVRVLGNSLTIGAFQGSLTFERGAVELIETTVPTGIDGQFHIVNAENAREGVIRFAGFATEKFVGDEAFRITIKPLRPLSSIRFGTQLEVAGGTDGVALREEQLVAGSGLRDAKTGALIGN